jgi:cell pole-organizing protein PopZ
MRQTSEPSVEEILESIKKVIARDSRDSAAEARRQRSASETAAKAPSDQDDVLDLAQGAELVDDYGTDDAAPAGATADSEITPLLTDDARESMRESFAALSMMAQPSAPPQIVRSGETSLEGMVRELLRPALAEWLDKNLPPLVERMISAEISRIVGKKA